MYVFRSGKLRRIKECKKQSDRIMSIVQAEFEAVLENDIEEASETHKLRAMFDFCMDTLATLAVNGRVVVAYDTYDTPDAMDNFKEAWESLTAIPATSWSLVPPREVPVSGDVREPIPWSYQP